MNKKPSQWWFACSIPIAMGITYIGWLIRFYIGGGWNDVCEMGGYAALIGLLTFPIGSPFYLWLDPSVISKNLWIISLTGYLIYLLLGVVGWRKQTWFFFLLLCVLLLANIAGCHLKQTTDSLPLSP